MKEAFFINPIGKFAGLVPWPFLYTNVGYTMGGDVVHYIECKPVSEGCREGANEICLQEC